MINGFTIESIANRIALIPIEDSFNINLEEKIFTIADGVTRDPCEYLPNVKTFFGRIKFSLRYPRPSPAKIAADIFTETFPFVLKDYPIQDRDGRTVRDAFEEANRKIKEWNVQNMPNPDYLIRDFAGCVASGAVLNDEFVYLGFIGDCGIAIFDEFGKLKFRTENEVDKHRPNWQKGKLKGIIQGNPERRRIIRRDYRNNPSEEHTYGVLTGEETAMHYVRITKQKIKPNEHLVLYSDGLEPIIFSEEFSEKLWKKDLRSLEKLCRQRVRTEGTLIYYSQP